MSQSLVIAAQAAAVTHADDLLGQIQFLSTEALGVLIRAKADGDHTAALGAIREARGCLQLLVSVAAELRAQREQESKLDDHAATLAAAINRVAAAIAAAGADREPDPGAA